MVSNETEINNFKVLDLLEVYRQYNLKDLKSSNKDILHPNKEAHRIAAEAIYNFLGQNDLLNNKSKS